LLISDSRRNYIDETLVWRLARTAVLAGACVAYLVAGLGSSNLAAQETLGVGITEDEGRIIYSRAFLDQFNVISAVDLLERIPGVQDLLDFDESGERGFGSTGAQVLINGQRLSGKSNDIQSALTRIQARQVLRIEVIRGNAPGLDVRSEGRIVNVVLEEASATNYGSWEGNVSYYTGNRWRPGAELSYSGSWGSLEYIVSLKARPVTYARPRSDIFFIPGSPPFAGQREDGLKDGTHLIATTNLTYTFSNSDVLNLNVRVADEGRTNRDNGVLFDLSPTGVETPTLITHNRFPTSEITWEIGGDYEHRFLSGDLLKILFLLSSEDRRDVREFSSGLPGAELTLNRRQILEPKEQEKIVRGTYRRGVAKGHTLTVGAEVAINTLEQLVQQFIDFGSGLENVAVPNPDSKVEEFRAESVTEYSWQPMPELSVEASMDTEYSRIKQTGSAVSNQRTFFYVRPRLEARYDITPNWQIRGGVTRAVSQLDFSDFVSSFRTEDSSDDVLVAGNPDLVPEKSWNYELVLEHRLPDDQGVLSLRGFYEDIEDHIHKIPVGTGNISAAGNVGSAKFYGVELKGGIRLDWLGIEGVKIDGNVKFWQTSKTDAFTGQKFRIEQRANLNWDLSFRHDTEWHGLSYGVDMNDRSNFYLADSDFILKFWPKINVNPFIEVRPYRNILVRLSGSDIRRPAEPRHVQYFDGNRGTANPTFDEIRDWHFGRSVTLTVRGTF